MNCTKLTTKIIKTPTPCYIEHGYYDVVIRERTGAKIAMSFRSVKLNNIMKLVTLDGA